MSSAPNPDEEPRFVRPETAADARTLLENGPQSTEIVAGGQSLMLGLRQGIADPSLIVDISAIPEYSDIVVGNDTVEIGATTTYAELESHQLSSTCEALGDAVSVIGDVQVRNRGTIGGAVSQADPAYDLLPPLLALDASVTIGSTAGKRTCPLSDFFTGPSSTVLTDAEIVEGVTFDPTVTGTGCYLCQGTVAGGRSTVGVGVDVTLSSPTTNPTVTRARVALGAVAPTPVRALGVERVLTDTMLSAATIQRAADAVGAEIDPVDDVYGTAVYKTELASVLTARAITTAVRRAGGSIE